MRNKSAYLTGAIIVAIVFGCGPAKELPDEVPLRNEAASITPDPYGMVPAASEPDAKALADRMIVAITQGKKESADKARICRVVANGSYQQMGNPAMTDAVRTVVSVWPDRVLAIYEFKDGAYPKVTFGLHGIFGWMTVGTQGYVPTTNPTDNAQTIITDITAQHWIPLTLSLTDHKAIFFGVQKNKPKAGLTTFKFGMKDLPAHLKNLPIYLIAIDEKSGLPESVDYNPLDVDQRNRVHRLVKFADHKDASGLMLPESIQMLQNDRLAERWVIDHWEFPGRFDDVSFDPPSQAKVEKKP
jgi:hypothetical protein